MEISDEPDMSAAQFSALVGRVRDTIRRRWLTMALVAAAIFILGIVLVLLMTPEYQATASVRIDPSRNPLSNNVAADAVTALSPEAIETEVAALGSVDVARDVVRRLKLKNDPEFSKDIDEKFATTAFTPQEQETAVAKALLDNVSVSRDKLTYILLVKVSSRDAAKSARIANGFAESYISTKVGAKAGQASTQADFFKRRLEALGQEVAAADARLAQYRAQAGIVEGSGTGPNSGTIVDQQIGPLSSQLASTESDAAAARATYQAAMQQIRGGGSSAVGQVLVSPTVGDLRHQRTEVLRNLGEVEARYGANHPESIRVHQQLDALDDQLRDETDRVIGSLRASAIAAEARAASLRGAMSGLEGRQAINTRNQVLADSLAREATAKRAQYERLSQMSLESTQQAQNSIAQAAIVGRADVPGKPSFPNKPLLFALSLVVGLAAGAGTIALQEMMVSGLRTTAAVERHLGIKVLSAIPKVPGMTNPADMLLKRSTSQFAESLRIARTAIFGVRGVGPPQVIAITSALPNEGKTTTALAFARMLAMNNAHTLLIECDVRRGALRASVGAPTEDAPGIVEILHGEAPATAAINPGDVPGLDHLLVRDRYFSSEDLFGSGAMEGLLTEMRGRYDHIVLDLPPLVGLADGRFIAAMADATVLAIRWDETPVAAASSAVNWLRADGANLVGALFTMVDRSAEAVGGLYYSKKYSAYYQNAT